MSPVFRIPSYQIDHVAYFKYGYFLFVTYQPISEELMIFLYASPKCLNKPIPVSSICKKQKHRQEKHRLKPRWKESEARTMAMQKSDELADVAGLMFRTG